MDEIKRFQEERINRIKEQGEAPDLKQSAILFTRESIKSGYSYNFSWMGRPIIQYPQDMIAMQEIIWELKPDLIIETGIAHGGSLIYYASLLELIGSGQVIGIDIEIRPHNRVEIEKHPLYKRIKMIEGSSISPEVIDQVKTLTIGKQRILVCLDSNHSHKHVLEEMGLYGPFVTVGSYLVVFDTIVEDLPAHYLPRPVWTKGNNPKTAVIEFLDKNDQFKIDYSIDNKLLISVAPQGYLKRVN